MAAKKTSAPAKKTVPKKKTAKASGATPEPASAVPPPAAAGGAWLGLARKYRPQTFEDLIGQEAVAQSLTNALRGERVSHAHLMAGPRGVGKTTSARILARALNCAEGPTAVPCGRCRHCLDIAAGNDMDVIEFDAASNTGVDQMRDLLERVALAPFSSRYKVYIIDEVHMLSISAFNALLKTLEEPPPRVVFVFATTEFEKVPETVRSRCVVHTFRRLGVEDIVRRLADVARGEGIELPDEVAREVFTLIAQSVDGGMRDALVALDQLLAMTEGKPDAEAAQRMLGLSSHGTLADTVRWLAGGNARELMNLIDELVMRGRSLERFVKGLLSFLHDVMLLQADPETKLVALTGGGLESARELAARLPRETVFNMLNQLFELEAKMKQSTQARFLVEFTFLRMATIKPVVPIDDLIAKLSALPDADGGGRSGGATASQARSESRPSVAEPQKNYRASEPPPTSLRERQPAASGAMVMHDSAPAEADTPQAPPAARGDNPLEGLSREELIESIVPQLSSRERFLERYLRHSTAMRIGGATMYIQFPAGERVATRMLNRDDNRRALEATLAQLAGRPMTFQTTEASPGETPPPERSAPPPSSPVMRDSAPSAAAEAMDEDEQAPVEVTPEMEAAAVSALMKSDKPAFTATAETARRLFDEDGEFARRAKMVRDFFDGAFVDQSGRALNL